MHIKESAIIGLMSVIVVACATIDVTVPYIDSEFQPYVDLFTEEANAQGIQVDTSHLTVIFGDLSGKDEPGAYILGECAMSSHSTIITIDTKRWSTMRPGTREELMFHELGHCVLRRPHCDVKDGEPRLSIMDSYIGSEQDYLNNRDVYIEELFHASERCIDPGD